MEHHKDHHESDMGRNGSRRQAAGNDGNLSMIGHVITVLSALVSIIGIISDNLGKPK